MISRLLGVLFFAATLLPTVASAQVFSFAFQGTFSPDFSGSGTFTSAAGVITSATGTVSTGPAANFSSAPISFLSGSYNPGTQAAFSLSFAASQGNNVGNFFLISNFGEPNSPFGGSLGFDLVPDGPSGSTGVRITISQVAVPGPVAGAGLIPLLGLAGAWYSRRRKQLAS
jgi:hypothetical protein